jgi:hypothetical protein
VEVTSIKKDSASVLQCSTYTRHHAYLEDTKLANKLRSGLKRKAVSDEVKTLETKKQALPQTDIDSITTSADQFAEKADTARDVTLDIKSNLIL